MLARPTPALRSSGNGMSRALGALLLGAALVLAAMVFDTGSLYVPGVALLLASAGALAWVGLAGAGAGIDTEPGPPTVEERRPYPLRLTVHTGLLPAPGGELETELLEEPISLAGMSARRLRIDVQFERRGRRVIEPPSFTIHDPLRLVTRTVRDHGDDAELLVLPRIEPVVTPGGSGGAGGGRPGRRPERGRRAARRGGGIGRRAGPGRAASLPHRHPRLAHPLARGGAQRRDAGAAPDRRVRLGAAGGAGRQRPAVRGGAGRRRPRRRLAVGVRRPPRWARAAAAR